MKAFKTHTVIIGNGIAGISCARHLRKLGNDEITIISGETPHFYSRTALMYVFMGQMKFDQTKPYEDDFWRKNRLNLLQDWVTAVDVEKRCVRLQNKGVLHFDRLVIASGSKPRTGGWPGEDLKGVQGFYSLDHLKQMESSFTGAQMPEHALVIGGGLIGVELAEMIRSRGVKTTMLVREPRFWAKFLDDKEALLVAEHMMSKGVNVLFNAEIKSLHGDGDGCLTGAALKDGTVLPATWAGVAIGVEPNIAFLNGSGIACDKGVLVDQQFQTNVDGVYAIGDCAQFKEPLPGQNEIYQVWYTGRIMGETLAYLLHGKSEGFYPGPWFNSAKFFELEFQTYGSVQAVATAGQKAFTWVDFEAQKSIKVLFDVDKNKFLGMNAIGVRIRHDKMAFYLRESWLVTDVLSRMDEWLFDGEFTSSVMPTFLAAWNDAFPDLKINPKKQKWWFLKV